MSANSENRRTEHRSTRRLFARHPDARRVVLGGAGHLPWLQGPAFREELCAFFSC